MIIYLDESGNLGFNFDILKTSHYLVIGLLVFFDRVSHTEMIRAVRKTLKKKMPKRIYELKGIHLDLSLKKYFLRASKKENNWCLYTAIADKKSWLAHHTSNHHNKELDKKALYNELTSRLISQLDFLKTVDRIDIIVDRSKNREEIKIFDNVIMSRIKEQISKKVPVTITHRSSQEDAGLQAIDIFCSGIGRKYESSDFSWYREFGDKIAVEVVYKF